MPDSARARALVLERPHHLVIHHIPLPAVGDDDVLGERAGVPPVHGVVTP